MFAVEIKTCIEMPDARFTRHERNEWPACNRILGFAARGAIVHKWSDLLGNAVTEPNITPLGRLECLTIPPILFSVTHVRPDLAAVCPSLIG